jgi:predicted Zn-dependent protease
MRCLALFSLFMLLLFPLSCAVNPVTGRNELVLMSEQQEVTIGRNADPDILQKFGYYSDPALQAYVRSVGERLARLSQRPKLPFHFKVVDSPQVNAFALPGGYVYVTRGILAALNSEAELAGVLGHEIGHVAERHSVQELTAAFGLQLTSLVLSSTVGGGSGMNQLTDLIMSGVMNGYGRGKEMQADRLGQDYMTLAGYDPEAAVDFLSTLQRIEPDPRDPLTHWLTASHPYSEERMAADRRHASELDPGHEVRRRDRERYLGKIDGIVYGGGARDGRLQGRFYQNRFFRLTCQTPDGWTVQTGRDRWTAEPQPKNMHLTLQMVELKKPMDADGFAVMVEKKVNLRPGELLARKTQGGFEMLAVRYHVSGKAGPTRIFGGYLIQGTRGVVLQGFSSETIGDRMEHACREVLNSLRGLTLEEAQKIPLLRIRIHKVRPGESFGTLTEALLGDPGKAREVAALNNMSPTEQLRPGTTLKVISY